ncbi:MAG: aminopeptidase [Eubacterium sp.]|nr:aminopeptidase [Eubacterium sp.]
MKDNVWLTYSDEDRQELNALAERYKAFLSTCKTERECTAFFRKEAENAGYEDLNDRIASGTPLKEGDRIYAVWMNKTIALFQIGSEPLSNGMNILCAHIDSPRLDIKQVPLYEDTELAYLDTHYYGGIKKYQWVTIPLALHGVVAKKDGSVINVSIGEDPQDPVVYITDLLIHLAGQQMGKKASEVVTGENLDVLIGSTPLDPSEKSSKDESSASDKNSEEYSADNHKDDETAKKVKEKVKANILRILKEKYDIEEDDFISAEIEVVPAGPARDCGLDRSMIAGYGHDDRVCAYPSFEAMLDAGSAGRTFCCLLVDKEEIGSVGATGMESMFFENTVAELVVLTGYDSNLAVRRTLARSRMLSSDVSAAYDPAYAEAFEKKNAAYFGKGLVINKYTGARGKSGSNDANAEYLGRLRAIFDDNKVAFQTAELGKVDFGGGGTIAFIAALYGMEVVDSGVAVLSMHAPCEIISKADLYEAKKGYVAFLKNA